MRLSPRFAAIALSVIVASPAISWAQGNSTPRLQVSPDQVELGTQSGGGLTQTIRISRTGPPGGAAITFTATVSTKTGGGWLSVDPASGAVPGSITVRATPGSLAAGEYEGKVTIKPSLAGMSSEDVSVSFRVGGGSGGPGNGNGPPAMMVRPGALNFQTVEGAAANPDNQTITISSPGGGGSTFPWTATKTGAWLQISPLSGTGPGTITVSVNATGLASGRYEGSVTVTSGTTSSTVPVSLQVRGPQDARLVIDPRAFNFIVTPGSTATPEPREMRVKNAGSGALNWTAVAKTAAGGPTGWLSISPASGAAPSTIRISVNTTGLAIGMYEGSVEVTSGNTTETARVFLRVLGQASGNGGSTGGSGDSTAAVQFNPRIVELFAPTAGAATTPAFVPIQLTSKLTGLTFAATATTASGGNWLGIAPTSGQVPGTITVTAGTAGLANGVYNGMINVKITGSVTEQRTIPVRLRIGDDSSTGSGSGGGTVTPRLTLNKGGVVLQAVAGGAAPGPAKVTVDARGTSGSVSFQTNVSTTGGGAWLTVTPTSGSTPADVSVAAVNTSGLLPGSYRGTVVFQPAGSGSANVQPATLQVLLVVRAAGSSDDEGDDDSDGSSSLRSVKPKNFGGGPDTGVTGVFLNPALDFVTTVDQPEAVQVMLFGTDGRRLEGAKVQLSGLYGNSVMVLEDAGRGLYTGFFQASTPGQVALTARVLAAGGESELVRLSVGGDVMDPQMTNPVILRGGVVASDGSAPSQSPIAPGSAISILGRSLASDDIHVFIGGVEAAVLRVRSDAPDGIEQIDVQAPVEGLEGVTFADVVVMRNGVISAPEGATLGSVSRQQP